MGLGTAPGEKLKDMESLNVDKALRPAVAPDEHKHKPAGTTDAPQVEATTTDVAEGTNLDETQDAANALPKKKREVREKPFCACGCGARLTSTNPNRIFLQGHDAKCKKLLRMVADGEESPRSVSKHTAENADKMKFLKKDVDLARAMTEIRKAYGLKPTW